MITYILDANVVLRFLMKDHEEMWRGGHALFQKAYDGEITLELEVAIVAEIAYTMVGFYRRSRTEVADPQRHGGDRQVQDQEIGRAHV